MRKIHAIILAGGRGFRLGNDLPKQFINLNGKPIIAWSLEIFNNISEISGIVITIPTNYNDQLKEIISKYKITKNTQIIPGGATRQESSYNALCSINYNNNDILIFHDAARPFINRAIISKCIETTKSHDASGVYIKAIDTIAEAEGGHVKSILQRNKLYYTQTPQSFKYKVIKEAHEIAVSKNITNATDDAQLAIDAGYRVKIIEGNYMNIKITTPSDLELARFIADNIDQ